MTNIILYNSQNTHSMSAPPQPDIIFALLVTAGLLLFVKLAAMVYMLYDIEMEKYRMRKYRALKEKVLTEDRVKTMYSKFRDKYNGCQLEFPFVKAIDDEYVAARYNLNEDTE